MTFYEMLEQVIALLQRHERLSYRALKVDFDLTDDRLDLLKEELIDIQQLAVDQDGRMLVWIGQSETKTGAVSTPPAKPEVTPEVQPTQAASPTEPPTPNAERRQLTVMFCDLADSTKLSGQLDPEDLRDVIRAYQSASAEVIERYDGYIAQHLGDGLMVYFGWPQAHEDDAQRAVHAGLGILAAMQGLNARLEREKGIRLAVRIGIHTGLVVVGEIGSGASQENLALGETPNIASRIEGLAEPDTVAISDMTYQLVEGYFECDDVGQHALKGVGGLRQVYHVTATSSAQTRLGVRHASGLTPLVGREQEIELLRERWRRATDGQGQVVLLSGEGGIGKSRLVEVLKDHLVDETHIELECRNSPYYQNTALYPMIDLLERMLQFESQDAPVTRLEKLEQMLHQHSLALDDNVPLFAPLLSLPLPEDRYPSRQWAPQRQRQQTLAAMVALLLARAERQPMLFILEDLHWADPSTLEMLDMLITQAPTAMTLIVLTCRPEFESPWGFRTHLTPIALNRFSHPQIETMVEWVAGGKRVPAEVMRHLVDKTDGVPLYVEEMTKAILESDILQETEGRYALAGSLSTLAIPMTLQDSLMARLDRLASAKTIAQYAAVVGRQFSYALLHAVSELDDAALQHELNRLVQAELLYQRGVPPQITYTFKHALIQDAAYQSLLKSTRQQFHQRVARVLTEQFPDIAEGQPELVAHHYTEAEHNELAADYWCQAGERANARSAYQEAIQHLQNGLTVLDTASDTPARAQQELNVQIALGSALMATKGWGAPEVAHAYGRARALSQQVEENLELFPVLWGLWRFYFVRAQYHTARELAEQCLSLAQRGSDSALVLLAHHALGSVAYYLGEAPAGRTHLEQGLALYQPQTHRPLAVHYGLDLGVWCLSYLAWPLWVLGYPDQARARSDEAVAMAKTLTHPLSLAAAFYYAALLHHMRRESPEAQTCAEAAIALSNERAFPLYSVLGTNIRGWALAIQGRALEGIIQMRQSRDALQAMGAALYWPCYLAWLAEAAKDEPEVSLAALDEALGLVKTTDERWWEAELYRLKGELLLCVAGEKHAEWTPAACFQKALAVARQQQAKSLELRAATSLARLWQSRGKRQEAYDLLAPVYGWFTEGFDTADLQDAKTLLEELEG